MEIRQYYYTSYIQKQTGQAGFQIKAMSPGLSPTLQSAIARLIDYRIPSDLNMDALETHPVALRYVSTESGESILLCSQSTGKDEYGRPGNFFTHAAVVDTSPFTCTPPVFFWRSPFWRTGDPEEHGAINSLPVLSSFDVEPTLHVEDIWHFLAQDHRRDWLYKLLCAVIQSGRAQRRVVIVDTDEHVALWIAAVSCLLPPAYRPLLTFATYHHDPCQAPYLITGTATRSSIPAILADSPAYFLLDAATGRISPVEPSPYAELAVQAAYPDLYESWLLPIFTAYGRRFPQPSAIDEQLDLLALYARLQLSHPLQDLTSEAQQAIRAVLPSFAALPRFCREDTDELNRIERNLRGIVKRSAQADSYATYQNVLSLLKEHRGSLDDIILEELKLFTEQFILWQPQAGTSTDLSTLRRLYSDQNVVEVVKSPAYLQWAAHHPSREAPHFLANLWCLLALTGENMPPELLPKLQHALEHLCAEEYVTLLERCLPEFLLYNVSYGAHLDLIRALFPRAGQLTITEHFWQIYLNALGKMFEQPSTEDRAVKLLDFWFAVSPHALPQGYPAQQFFLLLPSCELLENSKLDSGAHLSSMQLKPWYSSIQLALGKRRNLITAPGHTVMEYLHRYFPAQRPEPEESRKKRLQSTYRLKTEINRLFEEDKVIERHCQLMHLYAEFSAEHFWPRYWKQFIQLLTTRESERILAVFLFWFEHAYGIPELTSSSIPQEFFLGVSKALCIASKEQGFHETMQDIYEKVQPEGIWYPDKLYTRFWLIQSLTGWEPQ